MSSTPPPHTPFPRVETYSPDNDRFRAITGRGREIDTTVENTVTAILEDIRREGDAALLTYIQRYDGLDIAADRLAVPAARLTEAARSVPRAFLTALREAADNVRAFHRHQRQRGYTVNDGDGVRLEKLVRPIERVGVYVPAGTAPLVSSMVMNVVPAKVAGVPHIVVATPPQQDGGVHPYILAAADMLGVHSIYRMGGAQAIAALAYGTESVPAVDKIVGPGNQYVAAAKRRVFGTVGIDSIAGPSEIAIIYDGSISAEYAAADMLSQAEHGSGEEAVVCFCVSQDDAREVAAAVSRQTAALSRRETIERALQRYGTVFICRTVEEAVDAANRMAPEHLELLVKSPRRWLPRIRHAGAVFLGPYSPEPVGDYFCGTNHVLPTNGSARFASSLGVADFMKNISVVQYSRKRLRAKGDRILQIGEAEGLTAHMNSIRVRLDQTAKPS